ncbi:TSUP family transporter [Arthrobacter sp. SDTb3-6]|uniref:sulfite exporter TauE/SafE family protein n=1 Tax=Arthrobacter sp. SDTb3-6 TaxID=2713571 RepID=UPI00159D95DA|nr:TSUP family transporter [Arthrobacter sp. SDTb3-6]NVN00609.1 TSUP family transporter [Arthrobacter sp. SDTb3-6]
MISGFEDITTATVLLIIVGGFAAGWIDAVVGGGGLIQLPVMLMVPGVTPVQALATNKMGSIFGTATSSVTYYRRVKPDLRTALPMAGIALLGSVGGAVVAASLPGSVFKPIIVVALVAVLLFTAFNPGMGGLTALRHSGRRHYILAGCIGAVIGFYDGMIGPGTGSFLVIALVSLLGYAFLEASAKAKIVNLATNAGALMFFLPHGSLLWGVGLVLGAANMAGGYLGARTAVRQGNKFIRIVFLSVVAVLIVKLGMDVWNENGVGAWMAAVLER